MEQSISLLETKQPLGANSLILRLEVIATKQTLPGNHRKPAVISALPWEEIPLGHEDLRQLLQRDGLILLSWAVWDNHPRYGRAYRANWIKSRKAHRRYRSFLFYEVTDIAVFKDLMPAQRNNIDGYYMDGYYADYEFQAAPTDLDTQTIPHFVQRLKDHGVTVDFDFEFSIEKAKELELKKMAEK